MSTAGERYIGVMDEIRSLAAECGREPPEVVVVSKNRSPDEIRQVYQAGARVFGESRAQGFEEHSQALDDLDGVRWHFIGHLQTNKVSKVVGSAELIHSVDSVRLLECLDNRARRTKAEPVPVLLQVNVSGEGQKYGFAPEGLDAAVTFAARLEHVDVKGLMTMAPFDADEGSTDSIFADLRGCHERLLESHGDEYAGTELSMGMSGDFRSAIRQGATMIRIGTAIFDTPDPDTRAGASA